MKQKTLIIVACSLLIVMGCSKKFSFNNPVDPVIPPAAPKLSSPTDTSTGISINPIFTWTASEGAASYALQVSANAACTNFVYNQSGIVSTSDTVTGLSYSTSYYWRVKADKKANSSDWTGLWQFTTTSATAPIVVTNATTNVTQTTAQLNGTVNPNNDVTTYYFQSGTTTSYGMITTTQNAGTGTSVVAVNASIGSLSPGTIYHYRIAAANSGGTSYGNDGVFTTVPNAPVLSTPANNATGVALNPTLIWNASSGAASYALQVSVDSLFGSFIYNQSGLTGTSQAISGLTAGTKYYWRVNATNSSGTSEWSSLLCFTTGNPPATPTLSTPANGAAGITTNPTLTWNASSGATSYTLQVSTSNTFGSFVYNQSGLASTSQAIGGLVCDTTYYWRVNASDSFGSSSWSSVWNFATVSANIVWISIPAGNFKMGSLPDDPYAMTNEQPQHTVYLDAFQISKYEITNSQYKAFMDAGGYTYSAYWTAEGWNWRTTNSITEPAYWSTGNYNSGPGFPNHPVVGVSWYEAFAFYNWAGGYLPTEAQWEKAARGTDSTNYWPWGSTWDSTKCNSYYNTAPDTFTYSSPVGFFATGASPYGAYDMAGNVWEWCNDWYDESYYGSSPSSNPTGPATGKYRVHRGGSWDNSAGSCRTAYRHYFLDPDCRYYYLGFRLAK
ncbi:SUMF1/EgtB/PvdO family nonheme iron enzyme [candidate division TA06 bacterium]|uniref:SUMF1/EgtB/PvdO family nonheme iron enzyme n=1 Tax=candidate division TA06 bacterium TaxID=2250710 RepID=A0A933I7C9_UNCT6|nr:SUMF1/EgtB/PvdO family nonheme iron enzyme [candidate division TA06 bacterium]